MSEKNGSGPGLAQVLTLLKQHSDAIDGLRTLRVLRSSNGPAGDHAEWLVKEKLGYELNLHGSTRGYDACDKTTGPRYEIKGRRDVSKSSSFRVSAIRALQERQFDYLITVRFGKDFEVTEALKIPYAVVAECAGFSKHANASVFYVRGGIRDRADVEDITALLR